MTIEEKIERLYRCKNEIESQIIALSSTNEDCVLDETLGKMYSAMEDLNNVINRYLYVLNKD